MEEGPCILPSLLRVPPRVFLLTGEESCYTVDGANATMPHPRQRVVTKRNNWVFLWAHLVCDGGGHPSVDGGMDKCVRLGRTQRGGQWRRGKASADWVQCLCVGRL